jgi:exonuclease SbcD
MIKILHLADLHIGMENYGQLDPTTGLHSRLNDYLHSFDSAIQLGLEQEVDLVLIAGDIYKNRTPNPTHQREFARRIARLRSAGLPVVILVGNHDVSPAVGRAHAIEIFDTLAVDGVLIADRARTHQIETRKGTLQLITLPWVTRQVFMTREDAQRASLLELEMLLLNRVEQFVDSSIRSLDPALPAVLVAHATIEGATVGIERQIMLGKDLSLPRSLVNRPELDYVALGHIHKHQVLNHVPPVVYPGSIERIDFGEEHEAKGCVIVELERGQTHWTFHQLPARPFVTIEVDVRNSADPHARVVTAIEKQTVTNAVVRLLIEAKNEQVGQIRPEALRALLTERGANHIAAVSVEVERITRNRLGERAHELLDGLTPRRALEFYLQSEKTDPDRIRELLAAADELLGNPEV